MSARTQLIAALVAGCSMMPIAAHAALQDCDVSATPVAFGAYDPLVASPKQSVGTISVNCTVTLVALLVTWDIRLSTGSSGSFANRRMMNGASPLNYNLYRDADYGAIWGDGTAGTSYLSEITLFAVGTTSQSFSVYGRIPVAQDRPAGAYSDTIVVTLNF